jgi:hypothetical protein
MLRIEHPREREREMYSITLRPKGMEIGFS